ncbi:gamma-glutamyl-gamma-aminobutyrate hydrolase family protein [Rhodococcus wratislaviensis]|uniref:gamma-glutamyl-gamma-aminobutyrate hydrolase family protein n=1 Tax=Rhodococcus wratislaviensis TaxID=44752 RepID=UPI0036585D27
MDEVLAIDRQRDDCAISLILHALYRGIPILGVCRGVRCSMSPWGGSQIDSSVTHVSLASAPDGRPVLGVQWHPEASIELEPCFPWLTQQTQKRVGPAVLPQRLKPIQSID